MCTPSKNLQKCLFFQGQAIILCARSKDDGVLFSMYRLYHIGKHKLLTINFKVNCNPQNDIFYITLNVPKSIFTIRGSIMYIVTDLQTSL